MRRCKPACDLLATCGQLGARQTDKADKVALSDLELVCATGAAERAAQVWGYSPHGLGFPCSLPPLRLVRAGRPRPLQVGAAGPALGRIPQGRQVGHGDEAPGVAGLALDPLKAGLLHRFQRAQSDARDQETLGCRAGGHGCALPVSCP